MSFPWNRPTIIIGYPNHLCRLLNDDGDLLWINIIATTEINDNGELKMDYYGLTHINHEEVTNSSMPKEGTTLSIHLPLQSANYYTSCEYRLIPTHGTYHNPRTELNKYCPLTKKITWKAVRNFDPTILFPRPQLQDLLSKQNMQHNHIPAPMFSFPILDTVNNRLQLLDKFNNRHRCTFALCTTYLVCPITQLPHVGIKNEKTHLHCTDDTCVRFFEKIFLKKPQEREIITTIVPTIDS